MRNDAQAELSALQKRVRTVEVQLSLSEPTKSDQSPSGILDSLAELQQLKHEAEKIREYATADFNWSAALAAVGETRRILELAARLRGELTEVNQVNNVLQLQLDPKTAERITQRYLASTGSLNGEGK